MYYTMLYGSLPFYNANERDLIKMIKNDPVKFPKTHPITQHSKDAIKSML
jgi:hypothetical protein